MTQPLRVYDYLALARQRVLGWVRPLSPQQVAREFPIGFGTLGRTLAHIMSSEWYYVQRIQGRDVPPYEQWTIRAEDPPSFADLEASWRVQEGETRAALAAVPDWSAKLEYRVTSDDGRRMIVTATAGDIFAQLALHEVHHRAQVMNMLRQMGVGVEDIDYNALMLDRREAP